MAIGRAINGAEMLMACACRRWWRLPPAPARASSKCRLALRREHPRPRTPLSCGACVPACLPLRLLPLFVPFIAGGSRARGRAPVGWTCVELDLRAVLKVGKAARNDGIASRDALADHRLFLTFLHNFHIGELRRIFRRDEINITSVRALLDGDRGHDNCVLQAFSASASH